MSETEYYHNLEFQEFLLSSQRRKLTPPEVVFEVFKIQKSQNFVDFGAGLGFFIPEIQKYLPKNTWIWAGECQHDLIDLLLRRKLMENWQQVTPFYIEKAEHPLLPEWVPVPDMVFASLCLSTFPNPGLAMDGLIRSMKPEGRLIVLDWNKVEYPFGPKINEKVSLDKMRFLAEDFKLQVVKTSKISEYVYGMEVVAGKDFVWGYYDLRDEEGSEDIFQ